MRCPSRSSNVLIDKVFARLPLFDDLSADALERLSTAGLGRGLLTPTVRARLRRAGFDDMGKLALATPSELTAVRKIGPVRVGAIRAHILDELARFEADTRARHSKDATARRRIDRLRASPAQRLPLPVADIQGLGDVGAFQAIQTDDLDGIVSALVRLLLTDQQRHQITASTRKDDAVENGGLARDRAELLRARDREWDEADPAGLSHARDRL